MAMKDFLNLTFIKKILIVFIIFMLTTNYMFIFFLNIKCCKKFVTEIHWKGDTVQ